MPPKKKKKSQTNRNLSGPSSNPVNNDETDQAPNETDIGKPTSELHELNRTEDITLQRQFDVDNLLFKTCCEFEIRPRMAENLRKLQDFRCLIVCDDSGSMKTPIHGAERTRWDKLCEFIKMILKFCLIFNSNGIDIHFLNERKFLKVKDLAVVDQIFQTSPSGYTPLVPILKEIFESQTVHHESDKKKLLVFVATDGRPTDKNGDSNVAELEDLMNKIRQTETTYVSFLLCTDDRYCIDYLKEWDTKMVNVAVTDDFHTERDKIRRRCNQYDSDFTLGDYLVKLLVGAIVPGIYRFNENN